MNLTNVFIDILRSAMTQTSCDMIEGLSTQDWEKIYDISQKQQLAPMIYQQIFSNPSFLESDLEGRYDRSGRKSGKKKYSVFDVV